LVWFVVWLIANNLGGNEPLASDPVNAWCATLILAIALDLGRAGGLPELPLAFIARRPVLAVPPGGSAAG
jgi:hypothetical protein